MSHLPTAARDEGSGREACARVARLGRALGARAQVVDQDPPAVMRAMRPALSARLTSETCVGRDSEERDLRWLPSSAGVADSPPVMRIRVKAADDPRASPRRRDLARRSRAGWTRPAPRGLVSVWYSPNAVYRAQAALGSHRSPETATSGQSPHESYVYTSLDHLLPRVRPG